MNLKRFLADVRESFWFLPSLIVAVGIGLAVALISMNPAGVEPWMARWPRLFGAGAAGARGMLSTIAGSMMSVVGVTFSMTLVTLALASSQYTSRILRNFMRDRAMQVVLGLFAGIFAYCLIVLRTIRGGDEGTFVPSLAVLFGVVLAIAGVGVLIYFIHHIASSIQASAIIASVAAETLAAIDRIFPEMLEQGSDGSMEEIVDEQRAPSSTIWHQIPSPADGYIQNVDQAALVRIARSENSIVRMERGIGEFVVRGTPLVSLGSSSAPAAAGAGELQKAFAIQRHRTVDQDAEYGIRQLVDVALRALSPGVNDTTTAVMCVDYLTAIVSRVATRSIPSPFRYEDGRLRVIAAGSTFASIVAGAFDQIRGSSEGNAAMILRMLTAVATIGSFTESRSRQRVLEEQLQCITEGARRSIASPHDLERIERRASLASTSLRAGSR